MGSYVQIGGLRVAHTLANFINEEALPQSEVTEASFWKNFEQLILDLAPKNRALLTKRQELQEKINHWYKENKNDDFDAYKSFLTEIGYLETPKDDFSITTQNVDEEVAIQAGPQLVVPLDNARYALNAANARWGSLYDALYGTDVISEEDGAHRSGPYNPVRGEKVIQFGKEFLDQAAPLIDASHKNVSRYKIKDKKLIVTLEHGGTSELINNEQLIGYQGERNVPSIVLLKNNGLHFEIQIDHESAIGQTDKAGVKDILLEAALSTIMDCEDSIAAVDAEDKVFVYQNWLGLMKGDLTATFSKGLKTMTRTLNGDRHYTSLDDEDFMLKGRSLMFVRNVGHLMTTDAIIDKDGYELPEGILDAVVTSLCAKHSLLGNTNYENSEKKSIYIVKPKMHSSEEVAFANELFNRVEDILGLDRNTLKIGVMDEERRLSLNLKNAISEVKERIVFINTGFLDRTGDEMHTSMEAGPMIRKGDMKTSRWLQSYEDYNVQVGLDVGFHGRAQIGKGMWAMPNLMAAMVEQKIGHPKSGANTAWVPSPTAATLHAIHYHKVNVDDVREKMLNNTFSENLLDGILQVPIAKDPNWSVEEIQAELDNNAQGILGYVVRWVEQGIGCSSVLDINNIALMEDRATLRISSQHMANWLHHNIVTEDQVHETFERMAKVVDEQNAGDSNYRPMAPVFDDSPAFQAACELVFEGYNQPNGYTEPILHRRRREFKENIATK